jgi:hypothetical protein
MQHSYNPRACFLIGSAPNQPDRDNQIRIPISRTVVSFR